MCRKLMSNEILIHFSFSSSAKVFNFLCHNKIHDIFVYVLQNIEHLSCSDVVMRKIILANFTVSLTNYY